jgi:hypothetical protein
MSWMSDRDIAKNTAVQNSIDNLSRCVRFYADKFFSRPEWTDGDIKLSIHYLRQRTGVAKRYGRDKDRMWL